MKAPFDEIKKKKEVFSKKKKQNKERKRTSYVGEASSTEMNRNRRTKLISMLPLWAAKSIHRMFCFEVVFLENEVFWGGSREKEKKNFGRPSKTYLPFFYQVEKIKTS